MSIKKDIDQLFQDKFKDFEVQPNKMVWKNIEAELAQEKKKKKIIPLWIKFSGIASAIAVGFFTYLAVTNTNEANKEVVNNDKVHLKSNDAPFETNFSTDEFKKNDPNNKQVATSSKGEKANNSAIVLHKNNNQKTESTITNNKLEVKKNYKESSNWVETSSAKKVQKNKNLISNLIDNNVVSNESKFNSKTTSKKDNAVTVANVTTIKKSSYNLNEKGVSGIHRKKTISSEENKKAIVSNSLTLKKRNHNTAFNDSLNNEGRKDQKIATVESKNKTNKLVKTISKNRKEDIILSEKSEISVTPLKTKFSSNPNSSNNYRDEKEISDDIIQKNPFSEENKQNPIAQQNDLKLDKTETTVIANVVPNALEELLKKNEKEKKDVATKLNRWEINSKVAPIFFSSASSGSPIDDQLAANSKTYQNSTSVGLGVSYAVTKKISIRSGINNFILGYNTNNVVFVSGLNAQSMKNIEAPTAIAFTNKNATINSLNNEVYEGINQSTNQGEINQKMGYFEVPTEIAYKLLDKKIGINIIGGFSTLFLTKNEVKVVSPDFVGANLGRASNLNSVHFSTNLGIGFKYSFTKAFQVNLEPTIKYQINTFSNNVGGFKPYFVGLYSGLSFSF